MSQHLEAPWTADQVKSINEYQISGVFHPFTCPCDDHPGVSRFDHVNLVATPEGMYCPGAGCQYMQSWVHLAMADWSWKPTTWEWWNR